MSTSCICAWCGRPLLDREHALKHGPVCTKSPVVREVRRSTLLEVADDLEEQAWSRAINCVADFGALPPLGEHQGAAYGAVSVLCFQAALLRATAEACQ